VLQHLVKYHDRHVQLLLVENLETGLDVLFEFEAIDGDIVFGEVVAEKNGPFECGLTHGGEVALCHLVDQFLAPLLLVLQDQPVLEEPQCLMSPQPDQIVNAVDGLDGLVDGVLPTGELSRRVDIVRLDVCSEVPL
jgi:hypothetical protein